MMIQCPDCQTKMTPKPPAETPEGTRVSIKCRCGTTLRFRMPGKPKRSTSATAEQRIADVFNEMKRWPL